MMMMITTIARHTMEPIGLIAQCGERLTLTFLLQVRVTMATVTTTTRLLLTRCVKLLAVDDTKITDDILVFLNVSLICWSFDPRSKRRRNSL